MKIKLLVVGKLKEKYLKEGIAEYVKRLERFTKVEIIEVSDEKTPDQASQAENRNILEKEKQRLLTKIGERDYVIALAIEGEQVSSEELSQKFSQITLNGYSTITFIIGGSLGLSDYLKKRANLLVSFGRITLPHQLIRLVLVEQIYRSFMIQQGSPYHK
ncbi:23S rRNA (pseudouridine(1915)-N(3))-methyltransferase RlmH [Streptococcus zalophi]|uniref:23S rRNA (pseudouridine(1915)-N(3))-methyltransferase RlmH n=1 Tax=Streptococcus zalophi TaxID=640031 RepID=UPI00215CA85E|nr:23S rRNA (pseudouridine(1915)-N(3))-methyltransferase RlmH [Streptococcus zalophi]MCR8968153.1 23S rRNA (pseudouridine(1915)-N(3))-methyltransferase RlmH [Streptococcus zalophi]